MEVSLSVEGFLSEDGAESLMRCEYQQSKTPLRSGYLLFNTLYLTQAKQLTL